MIVARDAGAANALVPIAHTLVKDNSVGILVIGFRQAETVFQQYELPLWAMESEDDKSPHVAKKLLEKAQPKLLLTGTSMKPRLDNAFWGEARQMGIPTLAVLDHWSNLWERFSDMSGPRFTYVPDTVAVMDELTRHAMIDAGCQPERLAVTGQPYFDQYSLKPQLEWGTRVLARRELGLSVNDALIVFASEPQAKYYGADASSPTFLGYTEESAFRVVLESLRRVRQRSGRPVKLIVKLHPLETPERLDKVIRDVADEGVRILRDYPPRKMIAAADIVTGMTSVFLLEAALVGKPAVSVQPGRTRKDHFVDHLAGLVERADSVETCERLLADGVDETAAKKDERRRLAMARGFGGTAARRVANLIYRKIGIPQVSEETAFDENSSVLHHPFLIGEKVYLRGLEWEDIFGNWYQWFNDKDVTLYMIHGALPNTVESLTEFYEKMARSSTDMVLAICDKATGSHVGNIGLHQIDWINRVAELGIVIGEKAFWTKGYGTEATRLVVAHGFKRLNLHKIFLGVHSQHIAAIKAYQRVGFRQEALLKGEIYRDGMYFDKAIMSIAADDVLTEHKG
jgi:RimJ/RimL family protein N-acetyltransferase